MFPMDFDFGDGGVLRFRSADELSAFLSSERNVWSWLSEVHRIYNPNGVLNDIQAVWNQFANMTQITIGNLASENFPQVAAAIQNYYTSIPSLPLSESARGSMVLNVRQSLGTRAAVGALATLLSLRIDGDDPEQLRGVFSAHEFLAATGNLATRAVQNSMTSLLERLRRQQKRAEDNADALDQRVAELEQRRKEQFERFFKAARGARHKFYDEVMLRTDVMRDASNEAIESIHATEKTFQEHMRLEAPVTYWRGKAKTHKINSRIAAVVGLIFAVSAIAYAYLDGANRVISLVEDAVNETHQWQVAYVVLTVAVFVLTVGFWIGRLISRTFVSQSHLAIDAEERATMVETYLALTKENKISDAERVLVLGSLFRPSADGLVKDDGAPDLSVAGVASRLATGGGGAR